MKKAIGCIALLMFGVQASTVFAQRRGGGGGDEGPTTWRNIGPDRGGRSLTSAGSSARPNEYYFGAVGGGLWKTVDGGAVWTPVTDGKIHSSSVGAVAVAPSNPDIVYLGMGETELRGNVMQGDGMYKTTDGGKTWQHIGLENTQAIARIRVDANDPDLVYVAVLGHPYGPSAERGVFRSTDGGKSWKKILYENRPRRRGGPLHRPAQPEDHVRHHLGCVAHALVALERRPREQALQVHRRRRHLEGHHPQSRPSHRHRRQDRRRYLGRFEPHLLDRRKRERRPLPLRGRRGYVGQDQRGPQRPAARLLLLAHLRRPQR